MSDMNTKILRTTQAIRHVRNRCYQIQGAFKSCDKKVVHVKE